MPINSNQYSQSSSFKKLDDNYQTGKCYWYSNDIQFYKPGHYLLLSSEQDNDETITLCYEVLDYCNYTTYQCTRKVKCEHFKPYCDDYPLKKVDQGSSAYRKFTIDFKDKTVDQGSSAYRKFTIDFKDDIFNIPSSKYRKHNFIQSGNIKNIKTTKITDDISVTSKNNKIIYGNNYKKIIPKGAEGLLYNPNTHAHPEFSSSFVGKEIQNNFKLPLQTSHNQQIIDTAVCNTLAITLICASNVLIMNLFQYTLKFCIILILSTIVFLTYKLINLIKEVIKIY